MGMETKIDEQQVREYAYQIWLSENCPQRQAQRHWQMARQLTEAEALTTSATPPAARPHSMRKGSRTMTQAKASGPKTPTGKAGS